MSLKTIRTILIILIFVTIGFGVGYGVGHNDLSFSFGKGVPSISVLDSGQATARGADFSLFWSVWDTLSQKYVNKKAIDPKKMIYGAISGMVASLDDPYTVFLTPQQNKQMKEELGGSFEGIGAQLGLKDKKIVVIAPLPSSPAERAGIKAGDWILTIDTKPTDNLTLPEAVTKIRGPKGTKVTLQILHDKEDKPREVAIIRDTIIIKSVIWEIKNGSVGYIKLSDFGDSTDREWDEAISNLKSQKSNIKGLVLDLRNNPGGYLNSAVYIASEFIDSGIVVRQENGDGTRQDYMVDRTGKFLTIPLVVLINKGSASASEIVAGSLRDHGRAKLVGETSFGKGSVQETQDLPEGAGLHVTTAKWLLPSGTWINGKGLTPDFSVSPDEKNPEKDLQLEKAIELLQ